MTISSENSAPVVLVDGSSYLYRAFHALPPLTNSKGIPTGAVKGVINMLRSLLRQFPHSPVVVVFDAKGKTFRDDMFPQYKANRPPMPDDLRVQIEPIHEIVKAMGLPLICTPGVEADDVIGTFARQATEVGCEVVVSTGDKDMAQLVNEHVTLMNTMTNTTMDVAGVIEKFGIRPDQIIDYLALMGDKVDNIPGVEKCGPKTAVKWLDAYGTLQGVIDNADKVKGKVGENLRSALPQLPLSYELATIRLDVELEEHIGDFTLPEAQPEALLHWFTEMEFKSWVKELENPAAVVASSLSAKPSAAVPDDDEVEAAVASVSPDLDYQCVLSEADFKAWLSALAAAEVFAFDTETTSLNYMEAELVGVSFAIEAGKAAYVPLAHDYLGAPAQLDRAWVLAQLRPLLEDPNKAKLGQNLKYDQHILANYDIQLQGIAFDTMLESYVLNSTASRHDMDSLAQFYLEQKTVKFEDIAGKGAKQLTFNQIELDKAVPYAAEDADITLRLHQVLISQLGQQASLLSVFETIELPLLSVINRLERNGALVDASMLNRQSDELAITMKQLEQQSHDLAGEEFNLASPKQLQEILFEKLKLPVLKKTPKGQPSTAEPILQELALDYPLPKVIMEYRSLSKLKSTYTDKLPGQINPRTGRIHTSYHQAVTATGRLSSSDPNLQNIPIRSAEGRRIRQAFIAPKGSMILAADYSQIELRIMAHLSQDEGLLSAFKNGLDVHRATAAEVFGVGLEEVSADQRRSAKAINFGLIYGMSAFGLAKQLHVGRNEAQQYMDLYFERYPGVLRYMDDIRCQAAELGYVETLFGRRLYLPEINSSNGMRRQAAERTAINAPMQGTAADIIKKAMINVDHWLQTTDIGAQMIMQVHDELVFEVPEQEIEMMSTKVVELMSAAAQLDVPLLVEAGRGINWDEAH
jgi:DNA polymerase-1